MVTNLHVTDIIMLHENSDDDLGYSTGLSCAGGYGFDLAHGILMLTIIMFVVCINAQPCVNASVVCCVWCVFGPRNRWGARKLCRTPHTYSSIHSERSWQMFYMPLTTTQM